MTMNVHPYAAAFPMMSDDELDALADDIKANGLRQPIIVDAGETLIDGRNRLEACRRAGVQPTFAYLPLDVDPVKYITSANVKRRQMTKGQIAIVAVRTFIDSINASDAGLATIAEDVGVTTSAIGHAKTIAEFGPDLADQVLTGTLSFDAAYAEAKDRRKRQRDDAAHLAEIRAKATDLAEMIIDERLTLAEAWAAYLKRTEDVRLEREEREDGWRRRNLGAAEAVHKLAWSPPEVDQFVETVYPHHAEHVANGMRLTPERIDSAIATLTTLRERITR